ncbi:MAG: class I SAM-dependent methyltransferase [Arenimonas sp.]
MESKLEKALEIQSQKPDEAARLFSEVLMQDSSNLQAHNALERMQAAQSYGRWMRINCIIDGRDDIFHFFANHELAKNPIREYLSDGWRTLSELMLLLEKLDRPLLKFASVLEFAAGYGRFTRHLAAVLPERVSCTDIMPGSIDFLREQFGVAGFESSHDPEEVSFPENYDLVFVLSMFTHLPIPMWAPWLRVLYGATKPGGLLVISVHNEEFAREAGVVFDSAGTHFIASSESPSIDSQIYGTTLTTRQFVENLVRDLFGSVPLLYQPRAFWHGQDAVVMHRTL